jgi:hypothetical protein
MKWMEWRQRILSVIFYYFLILLQTDKMENQIIFCHFPYKFVTLSYKYDMNGMKAEDSLYHFLLFSYFVTNI